MQKKHSFAVANITLMGLINNTVLVAVISRTMADVLMM